MLDFKLINWKYMNFKMKFKDTDHIFTIKVKEDSLSVLHIINILTLFTQKVLREKHGLMDDLKVCFNSFSPANEIANEMLTLQDCGIHGVTPETFINPKGFLQIDDKSIPTVQVFYDFKPSGHEEPIMLYFKKV